MIINIQWRSSFLLLSYLHWLNDSLILHLIYGTEGKMVDPPACHAGDSEFDTRQFRQL